MTINKMKCRVRCDFTNDKNEHLLKKDTVGYLHIGYDKPNDVYCIVFDIDETEQKLLPISYNWLFEELNNGKEN